jgi:hypothetical protein
MRFILIAILIYLLSCTSRGSVYYMNSFDNCVQSIDSTDLVEHRLTDLEFKIPKGWKVRRNQKLNGVECMDTTLAKRESKIRTFTVYEFDAKKTNLTRYFESQLKMIDESPMTVLETGTKLIDEIKSYYVVTIDTVNNFPINQVYFYTDYDNKRYTTQIAATATSNPVDEICKSIWIVNGIKLKRR